ncbi:MAG TPA: thiamine pyrophosphate-dependent enzyme [Phnomibacter sp.]|nr:thiamine pyrophosphate-dependent enzyme [Phnomibacter sp.]
MDVQIAAAHPSEVLSFDNFRNEVLKDYRLARISRETSLQGRREVLTGKAKFGIFGDGKEIPQIALAKFFKPGDWRSGYYRDQTWMLALGITSVEEYFAQLYANPDAALEPMSAGRQMNAHYSTANNDADGHWLRLTEQYNVATDMAPTAGQMPRSLGLALASKTFRTVDVLKEFTHLSKGGNEVCFCTIGDASTSEGHFWETINAAGVLQVPLAVFVWDDGYGISVPREHQTTKGSISEALAGMQMEDGTNGINIYKLKAWDYAGLCEVLEGAIEHIRTSHIPAIFHIEEVTQPQGHSTSGSHERYKSNERLEWEREWDCIKKMREWIVANHLADEAELDRIDNEAKTFVREAKIEAWKKYQAPIVAQKEKAVGILEQAGQHADVTDALKELRSTREPLRRDVIRALSIASAFGTAPGAALASDLHAVLLEESKNLFNTHLYRTDNGSALKVHAVPARYAADAPMVNGYEIVNRYFDQLFSSNPLVVAFGEDLGHIGDVNQGFSGLQSKHGHHRIFDTGIRELTIMGQGIGMALRGLRPIAEIQYLDYLVYGLQPLTDDVACLQYRSAGKQSCPLIVRTRGHRLEGIWHSGSPMGMIINSLRGMHVCVPRNMVQAVGMYNTLLKAAEPALMIECLNGYRLKEKLPANLGEFNVPLGIPEVLREGTDITIVSYGSTLRIIGEACDRLEKLGIIAEVIDVQTLLPFDLNGKILVSLKKTNRILFVDEDVPGGAAAYMYNHVLEQQGGFRWLDATPRTLTAQAHRPAYGSDGDYFSKPNVEDVVRTVKEIMAE